MNLLCNADACKSGKAVVVFFFIAQDNMQGNKKLDGFGPNVFGWNLHCAISVFDDVSMSDTGDYICWFYSTCLTL